MKEIKEKIDVNSLVPAPLDNKNVMLDWWKENMFDDGSYAFSGNTYLGFIAGVPVMATVKDNIVELKCIPQPYRSTDKLDDFGKHPAYQKKVMTLPNSNMQEFPGYYDMNDDSVRNENPYGEKIGDSAPFEIAPETIDNAISEAFDRLKKKSNRR